MNTGIQRCHRLLEDHRDLGAADRAHRVVDSLREIESAAVAPGEIETPAGDAAAAVLDEAHQRQRGDRLARARFADDRHGFAATDLERHVAHCVDGALEGCELDREAIDHEGG